MWICLLIGKMYGGLMKVFIELRDFLNVKIVYEFLLFGMLLIMINWGYFIINGSLCLILY